MIFAFIHEHRHRFDLRVMCRVLGVSKSGYYASLTRAPSPRARDDEHLASLVETSFRKARGAYGTPRIQADLRDEGRHVSRARIARLMRHKGLVAKRKGHSRVRTTDSNHEHQVAENVLGRDFTASAPDRKWVGDITYLPTSEGWLYLAIILDVFSRRVVGWAMSESLEASLVVSALDMAREARRPGGELIHRSTTRIGDRASQYASRVYRGALARMNATASTSRRGDCWDNAVASMFFVLRELEDGTGPRRG